MTADAIVRQIRTTRQYFDRSTGCLEEADSGFSPKPGMFTVAQQVAHVAQTIDWFRDGVFGSGGFDMDFPAHEAKVREVTSLKAAREWLDRATEAIVATVEKSSPDELAAPLPKDSLMGSAPRGAALAGIVEHTSHHRGALSVYSRLLGKTPAMPYM